ncbi:MAG: hypothetical protein EOO32_02285 [Comamonadaceae bacterium]|nr:MAG: hypothetical protein EOO32_02285 [Comamonadaceae bacterium]
MTRFYAPGLAAAGRWHGAMGIAALLLAGAAQPAATDLATSPLETSTATLVKPNILYVLDNSGSMVWDFMPDWAGEYTSPWLIRNSRFNGVYYDPAITYSPPQRYDGTSYTSMTSANTTAWTSVPYDGFGVMNTSNIPNTGTSNLFTNANSGTRQNLVGNAYHYTFIPGEYCTSPNLRSCVSQSAPSAANPYPAYLRWCANTDLTNCQASRIDSGSAPVNYTNPRYPGIVATASITVTGFLLTSVTGITVGGVQILSAPTLPNLLINNTAANVVSNINACTTAATGNCGTAGYSATRSGNVITITAPSGDVNGVTPVISGTASSSASPFSGGTPGRSVLTSIVAATPTYAYPGTTARATTRTDCATPSPLPATPLTCTYAEEMTNFANWWAYYRTRMQTMKSASSIAFGAIDSGYRLGYMSINDNSNTVDFLNVASNTTSSGGQKAQWYDRLVTALPDGGTPLRYALSQAGRYYGGKVSSINGVNTTDPMEYACQRNYTLLSTDGYWSASTGSTSVGVTLAGTTMGDTDGAENRPFLDGNATPNTLADVAQYYYSTDIRDAAFSNATNASGTDVSSNNYSNARQNMVTSTIGLGASGYMLYDPDYANATLGDYVDVARGTSTSNATQTSGVCNWQSSGRCNWPVPVGNTQTTIDDLWHAAVNGRGAYYSAANAADIRSGLTNFLNTVDATTSSSAAVAQSAPVLTSSTTGYTFAATYCSGKWFGDLARYKVNAATGATATTPDWSQSGAGNDCTSASGTLATTPLLDATGFASRKIYTYDPSAQQRINFAWDALSASMQNLFKMASISSLSQLCAAGSNCLPASARADSTSAGQTTGAAGVNLVNYLRGDRSNEGSTNTRYYRPRTHVLGDIVNSAPVYVQAPTRNYTDTGYATYKTAQSARQGMVYVGANDGMVHAFNADTGAEAWAYIPSVLLPRLFQLADKNYAGNHANFVDGQITQADVYYDGRWRTILVGGLGGGGRAFYALDVTDPTAAPTVLWEFSSSSSLTPRLNDADLGFSYGSPVVTKLSDGTWAAIVSSGYNNLSPGDGRGHLWVVNAVTGALIKKIDNGMGSTATGGTVTGCSVAPCPSGLAQISGWTDSGTNNLSTQIYGGDLYGNLWRFDITALTASGGSAPVQLLATLSDASGVRQPVTTTPELGLVSGKHVVYVGTGAYLGVSDVTTTQRQSMYAIKDPLSGATASASSPIHANPRSNACSAGTNTNCFVRLTLTDASGTRTVANSVTYRPNLATMNGWFTDMPTTGERIDVDPVLFSGTLVYVSNTPSASGACSTGGSSFINYVNYATGLPVTGDVVGAQLSTAGLSSAPSIAMTSTGKIVATTKDSTGKVTHTEIPTSPSSTGTRRVSWRRLAN